METPIQTSSVSTPQNTYKRVLCLCCMYMQHLHISWNHSTMAGLHSSLRPTTSFSPSSKLLLLLSLLPLSLAAFAFILQWRGGFDDPSTRWSLLADDDYDQHKFPGMAHSSPGKTSSDCMDVLSKKHTPSFPYFRGWKFDHGSDLNPKVILDFIIIVRFIVFFFIIISFGFLIWSLMFLGFILFLCFGLHAYVFVVWVYLFVFMHGWGYL